jgi:hypothetical protein
MDPATIQQIATEVVARLPFGDRYLVVMALVSALVGAFAALGTSYFKTRGQNLATKHDFDELLKQQEATAEAVEAIKSEVGQRDWTQREWTTLRRIKLEALLEKMHECGLYLHRRHDRAVDGLAATPERDCISELDAMATLYFRELKDEVDRFVHICREQDALTSELGLAVIKAGDDETARQTVLNDFMRRWLARDLHSEVAQDELTEAARSLLERIMNVDERPRDDRYGG